MISQAELAHRLRQGCSELRAAEEELTFIDSHFGDADHGLTMVKIATAIEDALDESESDGSGEGSIKDMLDDVAMAVMVLNGGSAVPLWNAWLDGLQEAAPEASEVDVFVLKAMFVQALEELQDLSGASVGDKTMIDTVVPATQAIAAFEGESEAQLFNVAAQAAQQGAESTKNFVSKFGRAKSYGEKTIGTPDAGAVSMACFFKGLANAS